MPTTPPVTATTVVVVLSKDEQIDPQSRASGVSAQKRQGIGRLAQSFLAAEAVIHSAEVARQAEKLLREVPLTAKFGRFSG